MRKESDTSISDTTKSWQVPPSFILHRKRREKDSCVGTWSVGSKCLVQLVVFNKYVLRIKTLTDTNYSLFFITSFSSPDKPKIIYVAEQEREFQQRVKSNYNQCLYITLAPYQQICGGFTSSQFRYKASYSGCLPHGFSFHAYNIKYVI